MILPNLTYSSNLLISAPKIHTDLLWDLSVLFIGLAVVYFLGVFYFRNKISSNSKKVRERKRELSPMISEFLFLEEDATKDERANYITLKIEIRQLLKDAFNRKVLSEVLLDLRKDISGEAQQSLFRLFQDLGLHKDSFAKMKSWRWQIISKGITELTKMEVSESYSFITKFINDKRSTIRKQAEIATVTLRHEGINYFLDTTKYRISEWQQLKLLDVIRNKADFQPPRFKAWLTSNNKYVVLFALRLIKHYNQNDANASLIELVRHKNNQIKEEAIACIKEFYVTESLDMLKLVFWNSSMILKIAILDAIAEIGSETDIEFLKLIDKKELNFSVKSKALSAINTIAPESIMPSIGIQDESRYHIPDDISEAVAKAHAKKHERLTGDKDEEILDEHIVEPSASKEVVPYDIDEADSHPTTAEVEVEVAVDSIVEELNKIVKEPEDIDIPIAVNELKATNDIEVFVEVLIDSEEDIDTKDPVPSAWDNDHLNFIPLVVSEEEHEKTSVPSDLSNLRFMAPSQDVLNMEVVDAKLVPYQENIDMEENEIIEAPISFFEEFHADALAFLPVVVDNEQETQEVQIEEFENTHVLDIPVLYEEVPSGLPEERHESKKTETEMECQTETIHKLKDIIIPTNSQNEVNLDYGCYDTDKIRNTSIIYEEIRQEGSELNTLEIEVIEPIVIHTNNKPEHTTDLTAKHEVDLDEVKLSIENEQQVQKMIDDLIADKGPTIEGHDMDNDSNINPDWDLDEDDLDFIPVSFEKDEEEPPSYIKIEKTSKNIMDEGQNIPPASIPKAIFGDIEFEASTRQLLNDLEEMGDQREIPFLKELLAHEKYDVFKNRINKLIDTYNHVEAKEKIDDPIHPFSVFQDLFRTCDTESKLILLNEVVEVGDEKEIHFLEGLIEDDSPAIRKKALIVLKELKIKLAKNQNNTINQDSRLENKTASFEFTDAMPVLRTKPSNDPTDMFDLNFDLTDD